jgi:hypothetical protein
MITIEIPFQIKHNGVRKLMSPKDKGTARSVKPKCAPNKALLRALTKAWHWQQLIDTGKFKSTRALARKFKVHVADVTRIMRMNLLAPDIQRAILDGTQPRTMNLNMFKKPLPEMWDEQRRHFGFMD